MLFDPGRLDDLREQAGVDALLASGAENVCYLTGIESVALSMFPHSPQCFAILRRLDPDDICFVSSFCEIDQILDADPAVSRTVGYGSFRRVRNEETTLTPAEKRLEAIMFDAPRAESPLEALVLALRESGLEGGTVAVDMTGLPASFLEAIAERLPQVRLLPASELFRRLRRIKTAEEVRRLTEATRIAEAGIGAVAATLSQGVTELEMVREFERTVVSHGARPAFTLIRIGRNGIAGQALPDSTELQRGDAVWFDVGCTYRGYWADIARVVSLGPPSEKLSRVYEAMRAGEEKGIKDATPGTGVADLFQTVVDTVRTSGVPDYERHHVGHAIGLEVYDEPMISPGRDDVLETGMVVNIEAPYYEFGFGAVNVEDPVLIEPGGARRLGALSDALHVVD